ncbi:MAG: hypothetical protein NXI24_10855 [bacterium]|nr:hypothetical protein [bacterium]
MFTVIFLLFLVVTLAGGYLVSEPYLSIILIVIACLFLWRILFKTAISWFEDSFTVVINEDSIIGRNLFGREVSVDISSFAEVVPVRNGFKGLAFLTNDRVRFAPVVNIDMLTFIYDYILQRLPKSCRCDYGFIQELRQDLDYWRYERNDSRDAYYSREEIEVLRKAALDQFDALKQAGVLPKDLEFGRV